MSVESGALPRCILFDRSCRPAILTRALAVNAERPWPPPPMHSRSRPHRNQCKTWIDANCDGVVADSPREMMKAIFGRLNTEWCKLSNYLMAFSTTNCRLLLLIWTRNRVEWTRLPFCCCWFSFQQNHKFLDTNIAFERAWPFRVSAPSSSTCLSAFFFFGYESINCSARSLKKHRDRPDSTIDEMCALFQSIVLTSGMPRAEKIIFNIRVCVYMELPFCLIIFVFFFRQGMEELSPILKSSVHFWHWPRTA